jgi:hypothetical protein
MYRKNIEDKKSLIVERMRIKSIGVIRRGKFVNTSYILIELSHQGKNQMKIRHKIDVAPANLML